MSTVTLARKPVQIVRRSRRVRDSWTPQERANRVRLAAQGLNDLVAAITNPLAGDNVWAVGSLTPADLRRFSA